MVFKLAFSFVQILLKLCFSLARLTCKLAIPGITGTTLLYFLINAYLVNTMTIFIQAPIAYLDKAKLTFHHAKIMLNSRMDFFYLYRFEDRCSSVICRLRQPFFCVKSSVSRQLSIQPLFSRYRLNHTRYDAHHNAVNLPASTRLVHLGIGVLVFVLDGFWYSNNTSNNYGSHINLQNILSQTNID
jgi:hypothetical protein